MMGVFVILLVVLLVLRWLTTTDSGHRWMYRNPYSRTCSVCDRQEDMHCWAGDQHYPGRGWWEEMRPGSGEKCSGHEAGGAA